MDHISPNVMIYSLIFDLLLKEPLLYLIEEIGINGSISFPDDIGFLLVVYISRMASTGAMLTKDDTCASDKVLPDYVKFRLISYIRFLD